jgi:hypothetical protein
MTRNTANVLVGEGWRDSIEALVRDRIRGLIEEILEEELCEALGRERYARRISEPGAAVDISQRLGEEVRVSAALVKGHRNGRREREVMGTVRQGDDCGAACSPRARRWHDHRMEEQDASGVPTPDEGGRSFDRRQLSFGNQHAPRRACAGVGIPPGWRQQGHGEPM